MSPDAAAVFAQVLPVLFLANHISNRQRSTVIAALSVVLTLPAEFVLLLHIAAGTPLPATLTTAILWAATLQLILLAFGVGKSAVQIETKKQEEHRRQNQ